MREGHTFLSGNLKVTGNWADLELLRRTILAPIVEREREREKERERERERERYELVQVKGSMAGICEHCDESSGSTEGNVLAGRVSVTFEEIAYTIP